MKTMLLKQFLLAASAAAYLVVPEVSIDDEEAFKALPIDDNTYEILPVAIGQSVDVPCPSCKGRDTHLQMDFFVEDGARLTMNGFELYPKADPWNGDLIASEVRANGKEKEQTLGYSLAVGPGQTDVEQGLQLINVELHIIQVGGRFVEDVPSVIVSLVKSGNEINIGKIETKEPEEIECATIWCEIQNRLKKTKESLRQGLGCSGRHHRHGSHAHGNGQHKHGRHGHNWGKLVKNIAINIVLPVLMGLTAGVGVAVVAMTLCSCLALLIKTRRAKRGSKRRCPFHRNKATIVEVAIEEEKTGLLDAEDVPPEYQDEEPIKPSV